MLCAAAALLFAVGLRFMTPIVLIFRDPQSAAVRSDVGVAAESGIEVRAMYSTGVEKRARAESGDA